MKLGLILESRKGDLEQLSYHTVVSRWKHKDSGSVKRKYEEAFTEKERNAISKMYPAYYRWYLVTGPPETVTMETRTLAVLKRAGDFFSTV